MSAPTEKITELMTLLDENQETMNAHKVRQAMEGLTAIRDEWPEPEDSEKTIDIQVPSSVKCVGFGAHRLSIRVEGTEWHDPTQVHRKRKVKIGLDEEKAAGVHHALGVYLETKKARRAERVVATCTNEECLRRLFEGDPRLGWLRCKECGQSFCCKRCSRGHEGFGVRVCTGQCFNIE